MSWRTEEGRERISARAAKLAWWTIVAMVAVVPFLTTNTTVLGIGRYPLTIDMIALPQAVALAALSWLGLTAWGVAEWLQPAGIRGGRVWWPLGVFLALACVSAFLSGYTDVVYVGGWFHYEGLLQLLAYGAVCFVAAQTVTKRRLATLVRAGTVTGALLSVYGILQASGVDPANWLSVSWWGDRAFATWGNPDFFGGYLLFPLAFSLAVMVGDADRRWRAAGAATLLLVGAAIGLTLTRGAWLMGGLAGVLMLFYVVRRGLDWRRTALVGTLVVTLLLAVTLAISHGTVITRAVNAFKAGDDGVGGRLTVWEISASAALVRPLFGSGPDTYVLDLVRRLPEAPPMVPNDPHNVVLYLVFTLGIPAALAAMAFVVTVLAGRARFALGGSEQGFSALPLVAVWCAAVAHVLYLMLAVSIPASTTMLFLCLGVLIAAGAQRVSAPRGLIQAMTVAGVVLVGLSAVLGARGLAADSAYIQARIASREGRDSVRWAERAVELNPLNERYAIELRLARAAEQQ